MVYSIFNEIINRVFCRTMTNGAESVFCVISLYYYSKLQYGELSQNAKYSYKYLLFEKNMIFMTFSITMAFLIRSSSLIGWVPLALIKIFEVYSFQSLLYNFSSVMKSGLFIAVPMVVFSIFMDSIYYGKLAFPQFSFLYVNIVQNISAYFGTEPLLYYF